MVLTVREETFLRGGKRVLASASTLVVGIFFFKLYSWCTRKKKDAQNKLPLEVWRRKDICIDMAESLCHPPETITALLISYQISRSVVSDSL